MNDLERRVYNLEKDIRDLRLWLKKLQDQIGANAQAIDQKRSPAKPS